jgi:hypothetical protein
VESSLFTENNIGVIADSNSSTLSVRLAKDITDISSIQFKGTKGANYTGSYTPSVKMNVIQGDRAKTASDPSGSADRVPNDSSLVYLSDGTSTGVRIGGLFSETNAINNGRT